MQTYTQAGRSNVGSSTNDAVLNSFIAEPRARALQRTCIYVHTGDHIHESKLKRTHSQSKLSTELRTQMQRSK